MKQCTKQYQSTKRIADCGPTTKGIKVLERSHNQEKQCNIDTHLNRINSL